MRGGWIAGPKSGKGEGLCQGQGTMGHTVLVLPEWGKTCPKECGTDAGTKFLDGSTLRRVLGLLAVRLLTLDGAAAETDSCDARVALRERDLDWDVGAVVMRAGLASLLLIAALVGAGLACCWTKRGGETVKTVKDNGCHTERSCDPAVVFTTRFGARFHNTLQCRHLRAVKAAPTSWDACSIYG